MQIQNDGATLNVVIDGPDDAPPILLLHGILASAQTWNWIVPRLSENYRVLRLDFRGHGGSDRRPDQYLRDDYVSDAIATCEQVAGRPSVVIGHSLGGGAAAGLAQARPDLVRGVVLEDASLGARTTSATGDDVNALFDVFSALRESIPLLQAAGVSLEDVTAITAASPSAVGGLLGEMLHEDGVVGLSAGMLAVDASVLDPVLTGQMGEAFDSDRPITVPVAAVAADPASPDAVTSPADLAKLSASSPHVTTHTLPGANHLIHDTVGQREPFWSVVEAFLASLSD